MDNKPNARRAILLAALLGLLASCASAPRAPQSAENEAKRFSPVPDRSSIYVTRDWDEGFEETYLVLLDGTIRAEIAIGGFLLFQPPPGRHTLAVRTREGEDVVTLVTRAGGLYFADIHTRWGYGSPAATLEFTDGVHGRRLVSRSTLSEELPFVPWDPGI